MKIVSAEFVGQGAVVVRVMLENGVAEDLFEFYSDELTFETCEFVGLSKLQAFKLYHERDVAYLRS